MSLRSATSWLARALESLSGALYRTGWNALATTMPLAGFQRPGEKLSTQALSLMNGGSQMSASGPAVRSCEASRWKVGKVRITESGREALRGAGG